MKKLLPVAFAAAFIALTGCGDREARKLEKKADPTFMFWCFRKEIVSNIYQIPDMTTSNAAIYIQNRLRTVPGYVKSEFDLQNNTMAISYKSSSIRKMNFEESIALSGFSVNNRPADPKAKIPEGVK